MPFYITYVRKSRKGYTKKEPQTLTQVRQYATKTTGHSHMKGGRRNVPHHHSVRVSRPLGLDMVTSRYGASKIRLETQRPIFRERLLYLVLLVVTAYMFGYLYELFFQWVLGMTRSIPLFILAMLGGVQTTQYIVNRYNKMWA